MMKKLIIILVIVFAAFAGLYKYAFNKAQNPPGNNPKIFINQPRTPGEKVLVCIGDSITHGTVSVSYVDILRNNLAGNNFNIVNAGINGQTAWNVLKRADEIIACNPDYITILIGTNDANGTYSEVVYKRQIKEQGLIQKPSREWFRKNLTELCEVLKMRTRAKIALISIPVIGEDPDHAVFKTSGEFSETIKETAAREGLTYLPLNETMTDLLIKSGHKPKLTYSPDDYVMYKSIARNYFLGQSFDKVSQIHGYYFLTDHLHLNSRGANIIASMIEGFVNQ